jgi:hypothetical protein
MKTFLAVSLAAILLAACSEPTNPNAALVPRDSKSPPAPVIVLGTLTNDMFTFDDGIYSASGGTAFNVDDLDPGGIGAASPEISPIHDFAWNKFLGRVDNHAIRLTVLNGGSAFSISYDLYIIGSWDGQGKQSGKQWGPDVWENSIACTPNGAPVQILINTTFSNQKTVQQSYPNSYGTGGGHPAGTGAYATNTLGYNDDPTSHTPLFRSFSDSWYKLSFSGTNPCGAGNPIYLLWSAPNATMQSNYDESWGIDNVHIMTDL